MHLTFVTVYSSCFYLPRRRHFTIFPPDRIVFWPAIRKKKEDEGTREKNSRGEEEDRTLREGYKVNKPLSRETRLHLNIGILLLSQSMKDVFISSPVPRLRFISITWAHSLEPANCIAKQCQWHFKGSRRGFDGILMLSGFWGDFSSEHGELGALKSGNNDRTQLTTSTTTHQLSIRTALAQGSYNCVPPT